MKVPWYYHVNSVSFVFYFLICVDCRSVTGVLFPGELRFTLDWISVPLENKIVTNCMELCCGDLFGWMNFRTVFSCSGMPWLCGLGTLWWTTAPFAEITLWTSVSISSRLVSSDCILGSVSCLTHCQLLFSELSWLFKSSSSSFRYRVSGQSGVSYIRGVYSGLGSL